MKKLESSGKIGYSVYLSESEKEILNLIIDCTVYMDTNNQQKKIKISQLFRHLLGYIVATEERFKEFTDYLQIEASLDDLREKFQLSGLYKDEEEHLIEILTFLEETVIQHYKLINKITGRNPNIK